MLEWGDDTAIDSLLHNQHLLCGKYPDLIMASDVVYAHSAQRELFHTISRLCPPQHKHGRVVIAHRWRANLKEEESFFEMFDNGGFVREEVGLEYYTRDNSVYRKRSMMDMKYPVSLFEMRRS